jgi:CBS domain-containing protein
MTGEVISVRPQTPYKEIVELLTEHGISAVPVVGEDGVPVGVVSEADLVSKEEFEGGTDPMPLLHSGARRRWHQAAGLTAADVMHPKVITIGVQDSVRAAARTLATAGVRRLFVVDGSGLLAGVVSRRDLLKLYLRSDDELAAEIREQVLEAALWVDKGRVDVAVHGGVVTLSGQVARRSEADIAVRLTRAQPGVVGVVSELRYEFDDLAAAGSAAI